MLNQILDGSLVLSSYVFQLLGHLDLSFGGVLDLVCNCGCLLHSKFDIVYFAGNLLLDLFHLLLARPSIRSVYLLKNFLGCFLACGSPNSRNEFDLLNHLLRGSLGK